MSAGYVVRRLLQAVPAVVGIVLVTFIIVHAAPGDPVVALAGESGDEAYYEFMRERFGLDRPLPVQFLTYGGNLLQGDFGNSFVQGRSVAAIIVERLPATLLLMSTALVLSTVAGIFLGAVAARRPFGALDASVTTAALVGYAVPVFWLAQLALLFLAFRLGWFPVQGMTDARAAYTGWSAAADVAHHLVLPALVLASAELALTARLTRTGLLRELGRPYVQAARARGVTPGRVLRRHALPNALLPIVTVLGTRIWLFVTGAVLVETVFAWPGLGRLLLDAIQTRDHPVLLGMTIVVAVSVIVVNLLTDFAYAYLDPRIRYR